ncbi:unnamed protein product [Oppiella nova]|uniref:Cathepsin L n=1 Tax=Oppiella nova TaxID=334625 RepID=A0A7R9M9L6_9ACAR|nr:unnamed protein product [Oppiella nova]CAG2173262.1 unnamed protein product [Oppiella nova]
MKAFIALALIVSVSAIPLQELESEWIAFKNQFRSNAYLGADEEVMRRQVFETNYGYIKAHNAEADNGVHTFRLGVNQFADMTNGEYRKQLTLKLKPHHLNLTFAEEKVNPALPDSVDWRSKNVVTHVKNQGQCGSCFAFSATDSIESQYAIKTGQLVTLSPQNIVDCIQSAGDVCQTGGDTVEAIQLVIDEGGIEKESDYPYQAYMDDCQYTSRSKAVSVTGVHTLQTGSESALQSAVSSVGPVSVAIDASHQSFQFYDSGVYIERSCKHTVQGLDHAVLAVGYGTEDGQDYWLIKNSWGTQFGENGYIKMARNHNNQCGVATYGVYPTGVN